MNVKWDLISCFTCLLILWCFDKLTISPRVKAGCYWALFIVFAVILLLYTFTTTFTFAVH